MNELPTDSSAETRSTRTSCGALSAHAMHRCEFRVDPFTVDSSDVGVACLESKKKVRAWMCTGKNTFKDKELSPADHRLEPSSGGEGEEELLRALFPAQPLDVTGITVLPPHRRREPRSTHAPAHLDFV